MLNRIADTWLNTQKYCDSIRDGGISMRQVVESDLSSGEWSGAKGSDLVDGHDLAIEAWGDYATYEDSGLTSFAYLWRRFGPPWRGSDDHKSLVSYWLTTSDPRILLTIDPSGSSLAYAVGYLAVREITDEHHRPLLEYHKKLKDWIWGQHPELHDLEDNEENCRKWSSIYWDECCDPKVVESAKSDIGDPPKRSDPSNWREDDGMLNHVNQVLFDALKELERPVYIRDVSVNIFGRCEGTDDPADRSEYAGFGIPKDSMDTYLKEKAANDK